LPALLASFFACCVARSAMAAPKVDDQARNAARELAQRARESYDGGDYNTAYDLYRRAYALIAAPTLSLREARSLEKLGRLVEAVEAYVRTARSPLDATSPEAFREAVREAHDELLKLRPRVPKLEIVIQGVEPTDAKVELDGKALPPALVGVPSPVNPGEHQIVAHAGGEPASKRIAIGEGETQRVVLELSPMPQGAHSPATSGDSSGPSTAAPRGSAQRTFGWVTLGVGAAGLGVGVVTGLMATSRHADAEEGCPNGRCIEGSAGAGDAEAFRDLRTVSNVGYVVGVVGVGAGAALLLTAPSSEGDQVTFAPWISVASAGVRGNF
jgi:hypothetical protein